MGEITGGLVQRACRGQGLRDLREAKPKKNHSHGEKPNECEVSRSHQDDSYRHEGKPYSDKRWVLILLLPLRLPAGIGRTHDVEPRDETMRAPGLVG